MTYASIRGAAEHIARTGTITPHQLAAFSALWESMTDAQKQSFTDLWRAAGSPASPAPGMVGPTKRPEDFGFKPGDTHLLVNDGTGKATAYSYDGIKRWEVPCLARGQGADNSWDQNSEDTPPGLYKLGQIYNDYQRYGVNAPCNRETLAYGWISFDLVELENQEAKVGRAGVMIHGGGTGCGWPGAWAPVQELRTTQGCVRMHNIDLRDKLLPLTKAGTVFVSVYQER
jgi:hypothetical protein